MLQTYYKPSAEKTSKERRAFNKKNAAKMRAYRAKQKKIQAAKAQATKGRKHLNLSVYKVYKLLAYSNVYHNPKHCHQSGYLNVLFCCSHELVLLQLRQMLVVR